MTLTDLAAKHNIDPESAKAINPCGGCGETDPIKRCLGCLHYFHDEQPPCDNDHVAEGCELFTGAPDDVA